MVKTLEDRDAMTERVQAAYSEWPSFHSLPTGVTGDFEQAVNEPLFHVQPNKAYVEALYPVCLKGRPIGRKGMSIVGQRLE